MAGYDVLVQWLSWLSALLPFVVIGMAMDGEEGGGGDDGGGDSGGGDEGGGESPQIPPGMWRGEGLPEQQQSQPGQPAPSAPAGQPPPQAEDRQRFEDLNRNHQSLQQQFNELGGQYRQLQRMLARAAGMGDGPNEPLTPEEQRKQRLLGQFFDLFPEKSREHVRKLLLENPERFTQLAEHAPAWEDTNSRYWRGVAQTTAGRVWDTVAPLLLGKGKGAQDLDEETRWEVKDAFGRWIERDRTGGRADRYEMQDPALVKEFTDWFKARFLDPGRRAAATTVIQRGAATGRLPVSGGNNQPVTTPAPKPDGEDEDALHKRAWSVAQSLRSGESG